MGDVNPYQPMAASQESPERKWTSRLLAVVTALLTTQSLSGAGLLVLGRRRLAGIWMSAGAVVYLLWVLMPVPRLTPVWMALSILGWVGGIVAIIVLPRRDLEGWSRPGWLAVALILGSLGISLSVRRFVCEAFQIPSGSMVPGLLIGDRIFVQKWRRTPARGDVIVFRHPVSPDDYIKRVVALPGETVSGRDGEILIDGQPIPRVDLELPCEDGPSACRVAEETLGGHRYRILRRSGLRADLEPVRVPPGHYFVLGDDRDNGADSRVWGTVPADHIRGVARVVWFSNDHEGGVRWDRIGKPIE